MPEKAQDVSLPCPRAPEKKLEPTKLGQAMDDGWGTKSKKRKSKK
jgi:hypothetical protein